jgi:hypothetical protein
MCVCVFFAPASSVGHRSTEAVRTQLRYAFEDFYLCKVAKVRLEDDGDAVAVYVGAFGHWINVAAVLSKFTLEESVET